MRKTHYLLAIATVFFLSNCGGESEHEQEQTSDSEVLAEETVIKDQHSYSNFHEINTTHLHLDLNVDFENEILHGFAQHDVKNTSGAETMILDVNELVIDSVILDHKKATSFELGPQDELMGQALEVSVTPETKVVTIYYKTLPEAKALQWLNPQQTAGKEHPFLFTQGEAILTRSWIPCQDTPGNRITYSADLIVPSDLMAVMSADNATERNPEGKYHFEMENPIPSYLIAMAVGDLEFASLGDRSGVYAEPTMVEKAVYEFDAVEDMIATAEELYGPYKWGRYDIIVLPPSFPFGGMENPKLTFATPTILAGDRSLVSLIAHELAHSWSGNLVTNATWDDFWLNEGFTVYFENRIMEAIYGKEHADMLFSIEYSELLEESEEIAHGDHPEDSHLKLNLEGRDPDDGMTSIAYVKGALFLKNLEEVAGRETFDAFLNQYFTDHEFQTLTTEEFIVYLNKNLIEPNDLAFNVDEWVYDKGIPESSIAVSSNRFELVEEKVAMVPEMERVEELEIEKDLWSTQEWIHFIREIPEETSVEKLAMLDEHFGFRDCGNAEIMSEWYIVSIQHDYDAVNEDMEDFLVGVGRRKFLEPIYSELAKSEEGMDLARTIYQKARPNYHSISYNTIDEILEWDS